MESRVSTKPALHAGMLVDAQVVENEVHLEFLGDRAVERVEEEAELPIPMPKMELRHYGSADGIECGEQVDVSVPSIVMGTSLGEAGT